MKFSDGYWGLRDGVTPIYPHHAEQVEQDGDTLRVYAATRPIRHRGDTLNAPILTVECHSPMADVIGGRVTHHVGDPDLGPHFELTTHAAVASVVQISDTAAVLRSGDLEV